LPDKFEAGTPDVGGAVGLATAIRYLQGIGFDEIEKHERELCEYLLKELTKLPFVHIIGTTDTKDRIGLVSFYMDNVHAHDVAEILSEKGVCARSGHHCAQPLMQFYNIPATVRVSSYFYNTIEEIDRVIEGLKEAEKIFL